MAALTDAQIALLKAELDQLKAQQEAIAAIIPGIVSVLTDAAPDLDIGKLPAIEVRGGAGEHPRLSSDMVRGERVFEWWVFAQEIKKDELRLIRSAVKAASQWCVLIPLFLYSNVPRLQFNGAARKGVWKLGDITDSGPGTSPYYNTGNFGVCRIRVPIILTS